MREHSTLPFPKDPISMTQVSGEHLGIVRCCDDPFGKGRVLVECTSLFNDGPENWAGWCEFYGMPTGSMHKNGDMGIWWPPVPGLLVSLGFEGNNPHKPYCYPAGAWSDKGKPYLPVDAKNLGNRKGLHCRVLKSEAGHTLLLDDNGQQEAMFLCDWTGAGFFSMAPGKKEDEKSSSPCSETRMRKGDMRGGKSAFAGNAPKPKEITKDGLAVIGTLDLMGQGLLQIATDGQGAVMLFACTEPGEIGASLVLDAKNKIAILTGGETQIWADGKAGHVATTREIIQEQPFIDVTSGIKKVYEAVTGYFKKYSG